jgi:hypothetical protein
LRRSSSISWRPTAARTVADGAGRISTINDVGAAHDATCGSNLRKGRIENPGYEKLKAIAKTMSFPLSVRRVERGG